MSDGTTTSSADIAQLPASSLIEAFGGVRPLAKKLDLAASTVQGWKLRDHIPESYHHRLQNLIQEDSLDVSNLTRVDAIATDAKPAAASPQTPDPQKIVIMTPPASDTKSTTRPMPPNPNNAYFAMPQATVRYWIMSSLATVGIMSLVFLILIGVFFGKDIFDYIVTEEPTPPVDVATAPLLTTPVAVPADSVATDLEKSREALDETLDSVKRMKSETTADQTALVAQIDRIETVVSGLRDKVDQLDKTLQEKGVDAGAIRQQMSEISRRDVLAAAMLLGVAQIHGMLDQQADFSQDLAFLKALMAHDPDMVKSLDKLGPFAEKGLMTREQILQTLDMVSKETVKVSQVNPNLSWSEKLKLAFANVIEIRKKDAAKATVVADTSTPEGQIAQAKALVADDEFALAAQILQAYQGPQADQVMNVAYNLQGRDAATQVLNHLLSKSQELLNIDQLKGLMGQQPAAPAGAY